MSFSSRFHPTQAAQSAFADRTDEQSAFDAALAHYVSQVESLRTGAWRVDDANAPRLNVLTYFGVGGIGKTTLLRKLAERLDSAQAQPSHWPPPIKYPSPCASLTLDMSDFDAEDALLSLRASVAALPGSFPAFDLCLARYWAQRHGDATIPEAFQRRGRLAGAGAAMGVGEQIQAAMEEISTAVLGSAVPGIAAVRGLAHAGSAIWHRRLEKSTLRNCPGLHELLAEPATTTTLGYYGYALAWDLAQLQSPSSARLVVFIDTFEEAETGGVEFLNRLIWMLPNVLFVIAGRNAVTWAKAGSELEFSGPQRWPTLRAEADSEPRQHLVGFLSPQDRHSWLRQTLGEHCPQNIIDLAASESQGLPVHLDLIAQHVLKVAADRQVTMDDVRGNLSTVARRVLRDLSAPQRRAALASSLYRWFDGELLRVTADLPTAGPIAELVARPYVEKLPRLPYPYRLHDVLRNAFRSATELGDDQWLAADWERAGQRGAALLRARLLTCTEPAEYQEHAELLFTLVATFGCDFDWLVEIAIQLTSWSVWNTQWKAVPLTGLAAAETWSTALAEGLGTVMTRQVRSRAEVAEHLAAVVSRHPADSRLDVLRYFLGQAQRDVGQHAASAATLTSLLGGRMQGEALKGLTHLHRRTGNFTAARELVTAHADLIQNSTRLRAEISWSEGKISESITLFTAAADEAIERHDGGEQALCLTSAAWCYALLGEHSAASEKVEAARLVLRRSYQSFADILAGIAAGLVLARTAGSLDALDEAEAQAVHLGQTSLVAYARFARCLALIGQSSEFSTALERLGNSVVDSRFAYLHAIACDVAAVPQPTSPWHDDVVLARWRAATESWEQHG